MTTITPKKAIAAFCKSCIYDHLATGTCLQQIENCDMSKCELYYLRPVTQKLKNILKQAKYDAMTPAEQKSADDKALRRAELFKTVRNHRKSRTTT